MNPTEPISDRQATDDPGRTERGEVPWDVRLLRDQPIDKEDQDTLGLAAYAAALESLVVGGLAEPPFTIAISGPWGSGKSSLAQLLQNRVRGNSRPSAKLIVTTFNAWDHSLADNVAGALAANVARAASRSRSRIARAWRPLPASLLAPQQAARRRFIVAVSLITIGLVMAWLIGQWYGSDPKISGTSATLVAVASGLALFKIAYDGFAGFGKAIATFVAKPSDVAQVGARLQVKDQLSRVIGRATRGTGRMIVLVDDIDRCSPENQLEICIVSAQLLALPNVIVVLMGDLAPAAQAADDRLGSPSGTARHGRDFIDKIVQFDVMLPRPTRTMMKAITNPDELSVFKKAPMASARSRKRRGKPRRRAVLTELRSTEEGRKVIRSSLSELGRRVVVAVLLIAAFLVLSWLTEIVDNPSSLVVAVTLVVATLRPTIDAGDGSGLDANEIRSFFLSRMRRAVDAELASKTRMAIDPAKEAREIYPKLPEGVRRLVSELDVRAYIDRVFAERFASMIFGPNESRLDQLSKMVSGLLESLPRNPRLHKRLVNQIFIVYLIASARGLMGPASAVTDSRLAKWAVLVARWPEEMGRYIVAVERESTEEARSKLPRDVAELLDAEPRIDAVLDRLVEMTPEERSEDSHLQPPSVPVKPSLLPVGSN